MPVPSTVADLSSTASSNYPSGSESIGTSLDDYLRAHASIIKQVSDAKADSSWTQTGSGAVTRTVHTKLREFVSVNDFGAVGDGVTNDSAAFSNGLAYVKANGGTLYIPDGVYRVKNLRLEGAAKHFAMVGAGKNRVILKHVDGAGTLINDTGSGSIGYLLEGFTVDAQYSTYNHVDARNGIAIFKRSNFTIREVHITDFKISACLMWDDDNAGGVYGDNAVIDCSCDGLGAGANGFLFVNMDRCSYLRVTAKGVVSNAFGPGYGVQFKNRCRYGSAIDIYADSCASGFAIAGDTGGTVPGASYCNATNLRLVNCDSGVAIGNASAHNTISNVYIDQNAKTTTDAIYIENSSTGNTIDNAVIMNLTAGRRAVQIRSSATDNHVHIAVLENINTTGAAAFFDNTAKFNTVRLSRMTNPRMSSGNIYSLAIFATPSDSNSFVYDNYPHYDYRTIAADTIEIRNAIPEQTVVADTEGAAATDDLATITNNYAQEGQRIILRTSNDARDVVVKHNTGNIVLSGSADFTLTTRRSMLCLVWNTGNSKWTEAWRVTNP